MAGRVAAVFFDLDGTLVQGREGRVGPDVNAMLVERVRQGAGVTHEQASKHVQAWCDNGPADPFPFLSSIGCDPHGFAQSLADELTHSIRPLADAVETARQLHARGYHLFPATTNGRTMCLAKLVVAGLCESNATGCFEDYFGGADLVAEGKTSARFYNTLLDRIELTGAEVCMVGDDPHADVTLARAAGIQRIALRVTPEYARPHPENGVAQLDDMRRLLDWLPGPDRDTTWHV